MAAPEAIDWIVTIAVRTVPTSTRNMTGLRIMTRGSSMTKERHAARRTMSGSKTRSFRACRRCNLNACASVAVRWGELVRVSMLMRSLSLEDDFVASGCQGLDKPAARLKA